mmetsp:Transcript_6536/g.10678  ORF Transcript_6536/g.10678 Transcript_6536/m.10678 type:complete len:585 (-) Transcript_6536:396-2150(-)
MLLLSVGLLLSHICSVTSASYVRREGGEPMLFHRELKKSSRRSFNYSTVHWHDDKKGKSGDEFGNSVSIQRQVALVASPVQSDYPLYEVADGKVFVFIDSTGSNEWTLIREISGEDESEFFGSCVALHYSGDGNYFAVVGAPRGNRYGQFSGGAYYFDVQIDASKDQSYPTHLVQKERHGNANFGSSVAISEVNGQVRVAIGATGHRTRGAVFVYTRAKDGTLTNEVILYGSVAKSGGQFGYSVAFNDNLVVVGAPMLQHGMVFVFSPGAGDVYEQTINMSPPATTSGDVTNDDDTSNSIYYYFGGSVAIGNGYLFIGCPLNNLRGRNSGTVYIYDMADKFNPNFVQTLFPPVANAAGLDFGWALSYDTQVGRLLVGSCNRDANAVTSGKAFIYAQKGIGYFVEASLHADNYLSGRVKTEARASLFGKGVSIYGDYAVVGAPFGNGEQYSTGDVYFYKAQTKEEYESSGSSSEESSMFDFESVSAKIALVVGVFVMVLIVMYRRYTNYGDDEGFGNFLVTECVNEDGEDPSFDEDSAHSQHPMIVKSSKDGSKKKGKKGKAKKSGKLGKAGARTAYSSVRDDDL